MSTLPPNACRLRVRYAKDGRLAYLGHLEVMETIMRSVRRSGLPFEVSNGFARRMRIQFSQALPVGAASLGEYFDLLLAEPLDAEYALERLVMGSPAALSPNAAVILPRRVAALEAWLNFSRWEVSMRHEGLCATSFDAQLREVWDADVLHFMRGDKPRTISLKSTLLSCTATDVEGGIDLVLETLSSNQGALRPAILMQAVCGCAPLRVCRVGQWHKNEDGSLIDPMEQL